MSALADLRRLEGENAAAAGGCMEADAKIEAQQSLGRLEDAQRRLIDLGAGVAEGAALIRAETGADRDLAMARSRDRSLAALGDAADEAAALVGYRTPVVLSSLEDRIEALAMYVEERLAACRSRSLQRTAAVQEIDRLQRGLATQQRLERAAAEEEAAVESAQAAMKEVARRSSIIRTLRKETEAARVQIVRRVFTQSLNRVWRDLFVRLAPEEPFVPRFSVPEASERIVATLETVHRDGERAGPPSAMLSSGNLNTAALTLFLALNLSVEPRLPWILLDDPVQSMDEVHVSQFAALLRTLTRGHKRRVVIAVHERALFDYLALELSPASSDENLALVELRRTPDGATVAQSSFQTYVEDRAFEPA